VTATGGFWRLSTEKPDASVKVLAVVAPTTEDVAAMVQVLLPFEAVTLSIERIPVASKSVPIVVEMVEQLIGMFEVTT
jgi:hypothetical protein